MRTDTSPVAAVLEERREEDRAILVWWGTSVACTSALAQREREGALGVADAGGAVEQLRGLAAAWQEITPCEAVRASAQRLLRVHLLRLADSLQVTAALVAAEHEPATLEFVSLDARLNEAAAREGFPVRPA